VSIRPLHQSVRPSPIFLAIVSLTVVGGVLAWLAADNVRPLAYAGVFIFVIAGFLVSLCLHEFAHAYTAWRFGDHDVAARGYLTLNPLKYSHPLLSLGLPALFIALGGIGLPGGAVYLRTSWMTKRQKTLVNLAGPELLGVRAQRLRIVARGIEAANRQRERVRVRDTKELAGTALHDRLESASSAARNDASPRSSNSSASGWPRRSSSSLSLSSGATPSASESSAATVDLPAPMKPIRTTACRGAWASSAIRSAAGRH